MTPSPVDCQRQVWSVEVCVRAGKGERDSKYIYIYIEREREREREVWILEERSKERKRGLVSWEGQDEWWYDRDKRATTEKTTQERAGALSSRDTLLFYETTRRTDRAREILESAFT